MTKEDVEKAIEAEIGKQKKIILNRNALNALMGAFSDPVKALGQVFIGRGEAVDTERHRLEQKAIIDLLCRIDDAITSAINSIKSVHGSTVVVQGLIETHGSDSDNLTGVHIAANAGQVEFKQGTHIRTSGSRVRNLTGLKIGGKKEED